MDTKLVIYMSIDVIFGHLILNRSYNTISMTEGIRFRQGFQASLDDREGDSNVMVELDEQGRVLGDHKRLRVSTSLRAV